MFKTISKCRIDGNDITELWDLGELYLSTNRPEKAKERLAVLQNCNCEEYEELKAIIDGTKQSKY